MVYQNRRRSGFHQILLQPGEEYKTAFQTHFSPFEFRVMRFGLTGALGTFQEAMNSTLAPFLRIFVLVFFDDILIFSKTYEEHLIHIQQVFQLLQDMSGNRSCPNVRLPSAVFNIWDMLFLVMELLQIRRRYRRYPVGLLMCLLKN